MYFNARILPSFNFRPRKATLVRRQDFKQSRVMGWMSNSQGSWGRPKGRDSFDEWQLAWETQRMFMVG